jgi:hypothetical protein
MRKLLLIVGTFVLSVMPAGAPIVAHAGDNTAVAINTTDGRTIWRIDFKISRTMSSVVTTGNAAVAISSCTDCQSYAIAVQAVLMMNDPSVVAPVNLALAENINCTDCIAFADAVQTNLTTDGPVHFTAEGNKQLVGIRHDLRDLADQQWTSLDALRDAVHAIALRLNNVIATELVPAGNR